MAAAAAAAARARRCGAASGEDASAERAGPGAQGPPAPRERAPRSPCAAPPGHGAPRRGRLNAGLPRPHAGWGRGVESLLGPRAGALVPLGAVASSRRPGLEATAQSARGAAAVPGEQGPRTASCFCGSGRAGGPGELEMSGLCRLLLTYLFPALLLHGEFGEGRGELRELQKRPRARPEVELLPLERGDPAPRHPGLCPAGAGTPHAETRGRGRRGLERPEDPALLPRAGCPRGRGLPRMQVGGLALPSKGA